jgi:hypothetical protein
MITKSTCVVILLLLSFVAAAQDRALGNLKRRNPGELAVGVIVDDRCGGSTPEFEELVQGVLIRARIKPLDRITSTDPFRLAVIVTCLENKQAFVVNSDFMELTNGNLVRHGVGDNMVFGTFGGNLTYLKDAVKESVEKAITGYLTANFDLAPE